MRFRIALLGCALLATAVVACNAGSSSTYIAPPSGGGAPSAGAVTLGTSATSQSAGTANGISGILTYSGGTGSVTATSSATAPTGTTAVSPAALRRVQSSATSPVVYYVTITSSAGATLNGLPAVTLTIPGAPVGTYQEAEFGGGTWTNVSGVTSTYNASGSAVEFNAGTGSVTIAAGGSIDLAFYQGNYPQATPTPVATPTELIASPNFAGGTFATFGSPVTTTGWTQCTISKAASGTTPVHPFSSYTPVPASTPAAVVLAGGVPVPVGTGKPTPTQSTVPVYPPATYAAVLGGLLNSYNAEDYAYNGLCQALTMPTNPTLTMEIFGNGNDGKTYVDFDVNLLDANGLYLTNLYDEQVESSSSPGDTSYRMITIPTSKLLPYAGQNVQLFVGMWIHDNYTGVSSYYFVDNVQLMGVVNGS